MQKWVAGSAIAQAFLCNVGLIAALFLLMTLVGIPLGVVVSWVSVKCGIRCYRLLRS